jgi:hypothetical protein
MPDNPVEQFRRLATSGGDEAEKRYKAICDQRDVVLAHAVTSTGKLLLAESGYSQNPGLSSDQNNQQAVRSMEEHLAHSSIAETDQDLLALVGTGALLGWAISQAQGEDSPQMYRFYPIDKEELDPLIAHRLAKALDRSPDHEPLLRKMVKVETAKLPEEEASLVTAAIQVLLSDARVTELEEVLRKIVADSILGG